MRRIDAATLRAWIGDRGELAILDAREEGEFGSGHLFWAVSCPLSYREMRARALLPRLSVRIACVDDGRGLAERLGGYLEGIGASDIAVLDGGITAWEASGGVLFSGINVPSKAFGEWVEHHYGTPSVDAHDLAAWIQAGRDMVVLDSRTEAEFRRMSIPGGINVPGGELAYRIGDLAPDPATLVVVNCAGRTRSILGAESLRQTGIRNPVVALRNGTMGWELAGLECVRGQQERFSPGPPRSAADALARARRFAEHCGVGVIGPLDLARFEEDAGRTVYVLDVRDPAEFAAGARPGSRSAPGGQLVQATDEWIGVRNARVALVDDDGVRARMAAAWLRQMGHRDVFVVEGALAEARPPAPAAFPAASPSEIDADALAAALDAGDVAVIDLARSLEFRAGHIPGAIWAIRSRLDRVAPVLREARRVVLTSPDGLLARLALEEARELCAADVAALAGGTAAWSASGRALLADRTDPPDEACVDVQLRPYDRNRGIEAAMRAYLEWETDLPRAIALDGSVRFGVPDA